MASLPAPPRTAEFAAASASVSAFNFDISKGGAGARGCVNFRLLSIFVQIAWEVDTTNSVAIRRKLSTALIDCNVVVDMGHSHFLAGHARRLGWIVNGYPARGKAGAELNRLEKSCRTFSP